VTPPAPPADAPAHVTRSGVGIALLLTAVLTAFWSAFAGLAHGAPQAWGVVTGAVVVAMVFTFGMTVTHAVAARSPALSLLVALLTYVLQLVLLVVLLTAIERSGALEAALDRTWVGGTIIVGTLVWSGALLRAAVVGTPPDTWRPEQGTAVGTQTSPEETREEPRAVGPEPRDGRYHTSAPQGETPDKGDVPGPSGGAGTGDPAS
jgi:ATP synthase protein I